MAYKRTLVLAAVLFITACGGGGSSPVAPSSTSTAAVTTTVTSLSITASTTTLNVGDTATVTATAAYSNGTSAVITPTWTSDNPAVLTVTASGTVTAVAGGTATVTATASGRGATALFTVTASGSGREVTVYLVEKEHYTTSYDEVKGTVKNTGTVDFTEGWLNMKSLFYNSAGILLAEDTDYTHISATFATGDQVTFSILIAKSDITGWSYYKLEFEYGLSDLISPCVGCDVQRQQ